MYLLMKTFPGISFSEAKRMPVMTMNTLLYIDSVVNKEIERLRNKKITDAKRKKP
jgi:hypothetical protein